MCLFHTKHTESMFLGMLLKQSSIKSWNATFKQPHLTAHNWQKWKCTFLTSPCHKIYREEAVGLKIANYTFKNSIFVYMWNLG